MKLLVIIIGGLLFLTYSWGWLINVSEGPMSTRRYTIYYMREVEDQVSYFFEQAKDFVESPVPRRKAYQF